MDSGVRLDHNVKPDVAANDISFVYTKQNAEYVCLICDKIMADPHQLANCGCIFCRECALDMLNKEKVCRCKEPLLEKVKTLN